MTAPSLFRKWGKKSGGSSKAANESLMELQKSSNHSHSKPHLVLPKSLSRRSSNETYLDSSSNGDSYSSAGSVAGSVSSENESPKRAVTRTMTLQAKLDALVLARQHSNKTFPSLETAYYNAKPSNLQQASYHVHLQEVSPSQLDEMLQAGLSPNPVSAKGDSYVHWVCRKGRSDLLQVLLKHGCRLQTCQANGRTLLHEACWSKQPHFELVETILRHDPGQFYMLDAKGLLPLAYVRRELRQEWMDFLVRVANNVWKTNESHPPHSFLTMPPNSFPIVDPSNALTMQVAAMVASGVMDPMEASCLQYESKEEALDGDDHEQHASTTNMDDDSESNFSLDENELSEILTLMSVSATA